MDRASPPPIANPASTPGGSSRGTNRLICRCNHEVAVQHDDLKWGRLTLNVLLSFSQFEREVIGERIRDKIAASKQKGMWFPPMAYSFADLVSPKVQNDWACARFYAGATARVPPHMLRVQPGQRPRPCPRSGECRQSDSA